METLVPFTELLFWRVWIVELAIKTLQKKKKKLFFFSYLGKFHNVNKIAQYHASHFRQPLWLLFLQASENVQVSRLSL